MKDTYMFSRKKIAAVSGLLGALALACVGVAQAYDGNTTGECTTDSQGNVGCTHVQRSESTYTSEDGTTHIHQSRNCSTTSESRVAKPEGGQGQQGTTDAGPRVDCTNSTSGTPAGITVPRVGVG